MTEQAIETNHIVCAVYGRPTSRKTVTCAIDLALEHKARLTFVHILDAEFLGITAPTMIPLSAIYQQLHDLGEFSMLILCDRATRRGVEQVDYIVREGNIQRQLRQLLLELRPQILVIGRPSSPLGLQMFKSEEFERFVSEVETQTNIRTTVVDAREQE